VFEHDAEVGLAVSRSTLEQAKEIHGWNHDSAVPQISYHDNLSLEELEQTSRLNLASTIISLGQKTGDKDLIAQGIAQYREALAGARSVGNIRLEIAILNKLAEALKAMGDFEATVEMHLEAIQMLQQALRLSNEAKGHPNDD
jgi:tetratricopeptide (TPR) repeat protein